MDTQILTNTLIDLRLFFDQIPLNLKSTALWLLSTLTIIDIGLMIFKVDETDWIKTLCRKTFKIGLLIFIITNYAEGLNLIMESFTSIGAKAGGTFDSDILNNPSHLLSQIYDLSKPLYDKAGILSKTGWIFNVIIVTMYFCGIVIAFQVFVTWLEFFALTGVTIIFIPFAALDKTSFIAEKAFSVILGLGVKLMILTLMVSSCVGILNDLVVPQNIDIQGSLHMLSIMVSIVYLICRAPALASSMMTGNPSLSGGDMASLLKSGGSMASGAVGAALGFAAGAGTGAINAGLGAAGKGTLGDMLGAYTSGGKAHTAGKMAAATGRGIGKVGSAMKGAMSGSKGGEAPTAPGGEENSHEQQNSIGSADSGSSTGSSTISSSETPGTGTSEDKNLLSSGGDSKTNTDTGTHPKSESNNSVTSSDNKSSESSKSDTSKTEIGGRTYNMPSGTGKKVNGIEESKTQPGNKE